MALLGSCLADRDTHEGLIIDSRCRDHCLARVIDRVSNALSGCIAVDMTETDQCKICWWNQPETIIDLSPLCEFFCHMDMLTNVMTEPFCTVAA